MIQLTENIIKIASQNRGNPGSEFELAGYAQGIASGRVTIANLQGGDEIVTAMVIPSSAFKKKEGKWDFDLAQLAGGMVYWNPINQKWLVVENAQTADAKEIYFDTYEQAKGGMAVKMSDETKLDPDEPDEPDNKEEKIKLTIKTNLKDVDINDKSIIYDEAQKIGIKIVENTGGSKMFIQNLAENEMTLPAFKKLLSEKCQKGYKTHPTRKTKKMFGKTYRNCVKAEAEEKITEGKADRAFTKITCFMEV